MKFVSWNLKYPGRDSARSRVNRVMHLEWDVLALQEVSRWAVSALRLAEVANDYAFGLDYVDSGNRRKHGAALLTRGAFQIESVQPMEGIPKLERGLSAVIAATEFSIPVTAISWHAPNAAGEGVGIKMHGYRGLVEHLGTLEGPTVLGFDSNHWNRSIDLEPPPPTNAQSDRWYLENLFFSKTPPHALRDAYLDYLWQNPREYTAIISESPEGPLATTYIRGSRNRPVRDRFDYIFVSKHLAIERCWHEYDESVEAGSDHASVHAQLSIISERTSY